MTDGATAAADGATCDCKVGRVLAARGLESMDADLAASWRHGDTSTREIAREINVALVRAAVSEADGSPLEGEPENLYRLVTDDEVTGGMRVQAEHRLERAGVDVGDLRAAFVSHQTVHSHLTDCRDVKRDDGTSSTPVDDRVRPLQRRLELVTEDALADADAVTLGDPEVYVDVTVSCTDCGTRRELGSLLSEGGCDCGGD